MPLCLNPKLTRKKEPWVWGNDQHESFEKLKQCLISAKVMSYYNPEAETRLIVDGSPVGVGGVLEQKQKLCISYSDFMFIFWELISQSCLTVDPLRKFSLEGMNQPQE
jgi:hypothetical protein